MVQDRRCRTRRCDSDGPRLSARSRSCVARQTEGPRRASNERVDRQPRHLTPAFAVSVVVHTAALAAIVFLISHTREEQPPTLTRLDPVKLVWIPDPRP